MLRVRHETVDQSIGEAQMLELDNSPGRQLGMVEPLAEMPRKYALRDIKITKPDEELSELHRSY